VNNSEPNLGRRIGKVSSAYDQGINIAFGLAFAAGIGVAVPATMLVNQDFAACVTVLVAATVAIGGLMLFSSKRFSEQLELYEEGVVVAIRGETERIPFSDLEQFDIEFEHRQYNGSYAGSFAQMRFSLLKSHRIVSIKPEFHLAGESHTVIKQTMAGSVGAIRDRLAMQLERKGELEWAPSVYLTLDAIRIVDGPSLPDRYVALEDVDRLEWSTERMKLWRHEEQQPFLEMPTHFPNFHSITCIFSALHSAYKKEGLPVTMVPLALGPA
jgi:hypothetical protein